jgi:hypothetical protein
MSLKNCLAASTHNDKPRSPVPTDQHRLAATVKENRPAPTIEPYRPFPVEVLPELVRGFVEGASAAIGCDPSYVAVPMLVAVAAAIGNTRKLRLKLGWTVPAILWGAIIGESGTAKTPAFRLVMRPLRDRQGKALDRHAEAMKQYETELARYEKDLAAWRREKKNHDDPPAKPEPPQAERCVVSDTTIEALAPLLLANLRGLLLARDELAGWIGSFDRYAGKGSADAAHWLSMHNGESIVVDRKTGMPRTIYVPSAAVSIVGGIQPGILNRALGIEHRESGLLARLLLAYPPRQTKHWTDAEIDPDSEAEIMRLFDRLYELQATTDDDGKWQPAVIELALDAKSEWAAYFDRHNQEQAELSGDMAAAWSKLEEYPARLALVIHFCRWAADDPTIDPDVVDVTTIKAGVILGEWFKREARRVYASLGESSIDRDRRRLVDWIAKKGGTVTMRDLQRGCSWLKEQGAAEEAIHELHSAGYGEWQNIPPTPTGGRPIRVFVLSTASTSTEPPLPP